MSELLVAIALYHRDQFSTGHKRKIFGYEAFHWAIFISPPESAGRDCYSFDATDSAPLDPVTLRLKNPTMDWWYRSKRNVDPEGDTKYLGRIIIGKVSSGMSWEILDNFFKSLPLPVKNEDPQQSCVTWVVNAIREMEKKGWLSDIDIDQIKDAALAYADDRLKGGEAKEPKLKQYYQQ